MVDNPTSVNKIVFLLTNNEFSFIEIEFPLTYDHRVT